MRSPAGPRMSIRMAEGMSVRSRRGQEKFKDLDQNERRYDPAHPIHQAIAAQDRRAVESRATLGYRHGPDAKSVRAAC